MTDTRYGTVLCYCLLAPLLAVPGCSTTPSPAPVPPILLPAPAPELALPAVDPAALGQGLQLNQHLTIHHGKDTHDIDVALAVGSHSLRLAAVGVGLRLITVTWDGQAVHEQRHPLLPPQVRGERMLRDLVLTWWPADALQRVLPTGWVLQDDSNERRLSWHGQLVMRVQYEAPSAPRWSGPARIDHVGNHYRIDISPMPD